MVSERINKEKMKAEGEKEHKSSSVIIWEEHWILKCICHQGVN